MTTTTYYKVSPVPAPGVSFVGSKIDKFMTEDGTMMEGWVVNLDGGTLQPTRPHNGECSGGGLDTDRFAAANCCPSSRPRCQHV